jgi:amino acid transporter
VNISSHLQKLIYRIAGFDTSVHISEEVSNAATAVPWSIVLSISIAGILGFGASFIL